MSVVDYLTTGLLVAVLLYYVVPFVAKRFGKPVANTTECKALTVARVTIHGVQFDLTIAEASNLAEDLETILDAPARRK